MLTVLNVVRWCLAVAVAGICGSLVIYALDLAPTAERLWMLGWWLASAIGVSVAMEEFR